MPKRIIALAALAVIGVAASACSFSTKGPENGPRTTDNPINIEITPPVESDPGAPAPAPAGAILAPGESTTGTGNVPFTGTDGLEAIFSHRVTSVQLMSSTDKAAVVERAPQAAEYDLYIVNIESAYVSGANLEYNSFSTNFTPVDSALEETQSIALIGYDFCAPDSIPSPGNDPSTIIRNCRVAAVPAGSAPPAGVSWSVYDTPYSSSDGAPAYFLAG